MRRIVLLLCLAFVPLTHCLSQTDDEEPIRGVDTYISPNVRFSAEGCLLGVDINFEEPLLAGLYLKEDLGIYYAPGTYYGCGLNASVGLKYKPIPFVYGVVDVQPNVHVHGVGHQVYGDYLLAYLRCGVGIGGVLPIGSNGEVYVEAKACGDIIVFDETNVYERDGVLMVSVGYRYKLF